MAKKMKQHLFDFEAEESVDVYMKVFKENQSLRELASVPFSLNLMINIFPQLRKFK